MKDIGLQMSKRKSTNFVLSFDDVLNDINDSLAQENDENDEIDDNLDEMCGEEEEIDSNPSDIAQKIKFSIKDFFSKCDQIRSFLQIWSRLLKKSSMENFIFYVV